MSLRVSFAALGYSAPWGRPSQNLPEIALSCVICLNKVSSGFNCVHLPSPKSPCRYLRKQELLCPGSCVPPVHHVKSIPPTYMGHFRAHCLIQVLSQLPAWHPTSRLPNFALQAPLCVQTPFSGPCIQPWHWDSLPCQSKGGTFADQLLLQLVFSCSPQGQKLTASSWSAVLSGTGQNP